MTDVMFPGEMFITIRTPHNVYDYCKSLKLLNDLFVFGRDKT